MYIIHINVDNDLGRTLKNISELNPPPPPKKNNNIYNNDNGEIVTIAYHRLTVHKYNSSQAHKYIKVAFAHKGQNPAKPWALPPTLQ